MSLLLPDVFRFGKLSVIQFADSLFQDASAYTWGSDVYGRLGLNSEDIHQSSPQQVKNLDIDLKAGCCGTAHNIVVDNEGQCYTWGKCHFGQLGHGELEVVEIVPRLIEGFSKVARVQFVAAGDSHVLVVSERGELFTWGVGFYGCLGLGSEAAVAVPRRVEHLTGVVVVEVAGGAFHSVARADNGDVYVWGRNHFGQLGLPPEPSNPTAIQPHHTTTNTTNTTNTTPSSSPHQGLNSGGDDTSNPNPSATITWMRYNQKLPVLLALPQPCHQIAACDDNSFLLLADGNHTLLSFGSNEFGQLGRDREDLGGLGGLGELLSGCGDEQLVHPVPATHLERFHISAEHFEQQRVRRVVAGWGHCAALTERGDLYTWGKGNRGQLGHG